MEKKEVLPAGIFLEYCGWYRVVRNVAYKVKDACSDDFVNDLSQGLTDYRVCGLCNRTHFNSGSNTSISTRRINAIRRNMVTEPHRYVEHCEPFQWLELRTFLRKGCPQRAETTFDCPCLFARKYELDYWESYEPKTSDPIGEIIWSDDGMAVDAFVEVHLPDGVIASRPVSAKVVAVSCTWGKSEYSKYFITDFSPRYKDLDILDIGPDPSQANTCFANEYFHKIGWEFAAKLYLLYYNIRLTVGSSGRRRVKCSVSEPIRVVEGRLPEDERIAQKLILERARAQKSQKPKRTLVELSDEHEEIVRRNLEFQEDIDFLVSGLELDELP